MVGLFAKCYQNPKSSQTCSLIITTTYQERPSRRTAFHNLKLLSYCSKVTFVAMLLSTEKRFVYNRRQFKRPSLRLLELVAVGDDGIANCNLITTELPAKYTTLSYCWGSAHDQRFIRINCLQSGNSGLLKVRHNLFDFLLQQVRRPRPAGIVHYWIDAICIDQDSIQERNHDVAQMGRIYSGESYRRRVSFGRQVLATNVRGADELYVLETSLGLTRDMSQSCRNT